MVWLVRATVLPRFSVDSIQNASRWIAFAALAIAMSWFLRFVASRGAASGRRKLGDARVALGLRREVPKRLAAHASAEERSARKAAATIEEAGTE